MGRTERRGTLGLALILTLALWACAPGAHPIREKGFAPTSATTEALSAATAPQRVALVVGVGRYEDPLWPPLRHATADARAIAGHLRGPLGGFDEVLLLEDPGRAELLGALRNVAARLDRRDTFLFYISGHGTLSLLPAGGIAYYLVAADTRSAALAESGVELAALMAFLKALPAEGKVAIFDSCFSGEGKSRLPPEVPQSLAENVSLFGDFEGDRSRAEALLMATGLGGAAQEDDRLGHGVFTHFLLRALGPDAGDADGNGDGAVSAYEAHDHAREAVLAWTGGAQRPDAYFRLAGSGQVFLAGEPSAAGIEDARIYAYAGEADAGYRLEVDGAAKGAFPRTIALPPGRHDVTVKGPGEAPVAAGRIYLGEGQIYPLPMLIRDLQEPLWRLRLEGGAQGALFGPGALAWGAGGPWIGMMAGRRIRGGSFRGLTLGPRGSLAPPGAGAGARGQVGAGVEGAVRRRVPLPGGAGERVEVGAGVGVGILATWAPGEGPEEGATGGGATAEAILAQQAYLLPELSLGLLGGIVLSREVRILLRPELSVMRGDPALAGGTPLGAPWSARGSIALGVEYGR